MIKYYYTFFFIPVLISALRLYQPFGLVLRSGPGSKKLCNDLYQFLIFAFALLNSHEQLRKKIIIVYITFSFMLSHTSKSKDITFEKK